MSAQGVSIAAFYKFVAFTTEQVQTVREALEGFAKARGLRGLIVLGGEGLNATVAGEPGVIRDLKALVCELVSDPELQFKDSQADKLPFARFKVDLRAEIITTKDPLLSAQGLQTPQTSQTSQVSQVPQGTHLTPSEWHQMMESDPDVVVVDTRNDYETEIGVFEGALDPKIKKFSEFKEFVERDGLPKHKKLLMYCTGGIRCEKAVPDVQRLGYENVYQLQGGILRYLEEYPEGFFKGECFVFDHRVAVDNKLQPSKLYKLCPHCGNPGQESISCVNCGEGAIICHRCMPQSERNTCSKNCAYHAKVKGSKAP